MVVTNFLLVLSILELIVIAILLSKLIFAGHGTITIDTSDPEDVKLKMQLDDEVEDYKHFIIKIKHKNN